MNWHTLKPLVAFLLGSGLLLAGTPAVADPIMIYVHTDHLGSPVAETDSVGTVIKRQSYAPYGEDGQGATPDGPGFTGHRNDADTGLVYMQARYYDPEIGRFLSVDPVTFSPDKPKYFNRYWYAAGNPYKYTDPDGKESACLYVSGCSAAHAPTETDIAVAEVVADFTPIVGDMKAIAEAVADPSAGNVTAAVVGMIPGAGDAAGKLIKAGESVTVNAKQSKNLKRFTDKIPANSKDNVTLRSLPGDGVVAQATSPGRVPGSSAVYEKQIDSAGETVQYTKTTYDQNGEIVHVKDKLTGE